MRVVFLEALLFAAAFMFGLVVVLVLPGVAEPTIVREFTSDGGLFVLTPLLLLLALVAGVASLVPLPTLVPLFRPLLV